VQITLNGEPYELARPMSVVELLTMLDIDPRRVAVEHNLSIIKRHTFQEIVVSEGDRVEVVNFVGGG
jgi:thiamine biosynthesis protein ThiS